MTSPGLKRPLDFESLTQNNTASAGTHNANGATGGVQNMTTDIKNESASAMNITEDKGSGSNNGNKRRCTAGDIFPPRFSLGIQASSQQVTQSTSQAPSKLCETSGDILRDTTRNLTSMSDTVKALIEEELKQPSINDNDSNHDVKHRTLTIEQTQTICERLIIELENRLREDYDKILAKKLAEQYDIFAKANYANSLVESAQRHSASAAPSISTSPTPRSTSPRSSIIAAALQMQRSAANATTPSISHLKELAASLAAIDCSTLAVNPDPKLDPQAVAAMAALAVIQHRATEHHQQHTGIPQQQRRVTNNSSGQTNASIAGSAIPNGPVLLTSNLDEQLAVPEALFTLFGVFGDVIRVKILFNRKDNALIQMADVTQAQVAQGYLDKQRIFGKIIRVTRSKHQSVQMPRDGTQSDTGLTKDFTNSPLHRFKIPGSRNYLNIYPPSTTLHISNIPPTVEESDLHKAFKEQCGFEFTNFKFFPKDRKMALMRFISTEHATIALIKMHNFQISEDNNLRVSFSKSLI